MALGLLTANCANQLERQVKLQAERGQAKYGVAPGYRGAGIPKGGGRSMVGNSYRVGGRTYTPTVDPDYTAVGLASWYGPGFHGRRTANGEIFDRHSFAAAHPTLPLPSYVRVTNLANNHSMVVRVNDRGPFHGRRIIDVSQRTAEVLAFRHVGTARVKVEYLSPADVDGSDDAKLLATLDDGSGSGTDAAPAPVLVAAAPASPELAGGQASPAAVPPVEATGTALVPLTAAADVDAAGEDEEGQAALPQANAPLPPRRPTDVDSAAADEDSGQSSVAKAGPTAVEAPGRSDRNAFAALLKRAAAGPTAPTHGR
ncbi:septal ring lytic transglycosylase RlpA family protein [Chelatococcus reniformis]|uniref:Endolytic peptidoglycan transglycosylase RlpA n=1 Tax=Chelatococcus reniformis TaxID=1494448 RepID=A0A916U2Q5_9HYPH|nr:septal ring lytic transglycosylase RlpA family protein [Chelatococcus reniformis]GGC56606.1 hypothetical protein GCM10010994_14430 [Chelatococcus reniformis]